MRGALRRKRCNVPANVAQLVEQLTRNEQVTGSSPVVGSEENALLEARNYCGASDNHRLSIMECPPLLDVILEMV